MTGNIKQIIKDAKSPEEIVQIASTYNYNLSLDQAKIMFKHMNSSGEVSDDELENVSGGGCTSYMKVGKKKYVVVSSGVKCFTGKYEYRHNSDWEEFFSSPRCCGRCAHCERKKGLFYCEESADN